MDRLLLLDAPSVAQVTRGIWEQLPLRYPGISLDEFVVMPNHIHGVLFIHEGTQESLAISDQRRTMLLSKAVGFFKMNTAKQLNQLLGRSGEPVWQRGYYEHVVRSEAELGRIREYIRNNPLGWKDDPENPDAGRRGEGDS